MAGLVFYSSEIYSFWVGFDYLDVSAYSHFFNLQSYVAWNLACGFAQNTGQLIAFRFLAGLGGSAPLSVRVYCSLQLGAIRLTDNR